MYARETKRAVCPFPNMCWITSCAICGFLRSSLSAAVGGDLTAVGARACDRDREENWPAYERAELLLAYEIMSLINGLQSHYDSASAGL